VFSVGGKLYDQLEDVKDKQTSTNTKLDESNTKLDEIATNTENTATSSESILDALVPDADLIQGAKDAGEAILLAMKEDAEEELAGLVMTELPSATGEAAPAIETPAAWPTFTLMGHTYTLNPFEIVPWLASAALWIREFLLWVLAAVFCLKTQNLMTTKLEAFSQIPQVTVSGKIDQHMPANPVTWFLQSVNAAIIITAGSVMMAAILVYFNTGLGSITGGATIENVMSGNVFTGAPSQIGLWLGFLETFVPLVAVVQMVAVWYAQKWLALAAYSLAMSIAKAVRA